MSDAIRAVLRRVHHLPWVCAAIILAAGLCNWAFFAPKQAAAEPEKQSGVFLDEDTFRQLVPAEAPPFGSDGEQPGAPVAGPGFPFGDGPVSQDEPGR